MRSGSLVGLVGWVFCFVMQFLCIVWFDLVRLFALVVVARMVGLCLGCGFAVRLLLGLGYLDNVVACVGA